MTNYRRNFVKGGSYFFTVALADRRKSLLVDHIDALRAAFRQLIGRIPHFTVTLKPVYIPGIGLEAVRQ